MGDVEGDWPLTGWVEQTVRLASHLKELKVADRLAALAGLGECVRALAASIVGWSTWLANPAVMNLFTEAELAEVFKEMRETTLAFLELDVRATRLVDGRIETSGEKPLERERRIV